MLIKVCGMRSQEDVQKAAELGANFCGFIFHPQSDRYISPARVKSLHTFNMKRVGVFVTHDATEILEIMAVAKLDYAQLHGGQSIETAQKIGAQRIIRVLWPEKYIGQDNLALAASGFNDSCAYFLLDAGKCGGGSGKCLNWAMLKNLALCHPWFLAGGLSAQNARTALNNCSPQGLDFNSGIEDGPGIKNHQKMTEAISLCRIQES